MDPPKSINSRSHALETILEVARAQDLPEVCLAADLVETATQFDVVD